MDGLLERRWAMDPNTMLEDIRELMLAAESEEQPTHEVLADLVNTLADLDEWLSKGGFPPEAWRHAR